MILISEEINELEYFIQKYITKDNLKKINTDILDSDFLNT